MITEATRRCSACHSVVDGDGRPCDTCGREQPPPLATWGEHARRLICLLVIVDAIAPHLESTEQLVFERLMARAVRGRWYAGGRLVPQSADALECLEEFRRIYARWEAAGAPSDFAAVAELRGAR